MTIAPKPHWSEISASKIAARDALIPEAWRIPETSALHVLDVPRTCGVLSAAEIEITETPAEVLVQKMGKGELKSYGVTLAFCKRAAIAQQLTNCLTEIFFDAALSTAKSIDETFASTSQPIGPLHGLPISLKDNFYVEGVDTTVGFVGWSNDPASGKMESEMTKIMRETGAVLFCKTNVPTAMMMPETYNNTWGYTTNPHNRNLTSGGSSGGEGSLLALKGSPLGVGTDIGDLSAYHDAPLTVVGIPAALCGLFSLKPSFGRFATYGARSGLPGQEAVRSINGPMSTSLSAVELWAKAVVGSEPWTRDPNMLPIPWREVTLPEQLCFGLLMDDGIVKPTPPVTRALLEVKAALEAAGHKVIEWTTPEAPKSQEIIEAFFVGDGGAKINSFMSLSGEDVDYPLQLQKYKARHDTIKSTPPLVGDLWTTQSERVAYNKRELDRWMNSREVTGTGRPIDGLIAPTTPYSSTPKYTFKYYHYTSPYNISDQSVATFPVTTADPSVDVKPAYDPRDHSRRRYGRFVSTTFAASDI
ncbi:hypothetical protein EHS25_000026 [Saitozyma podzolica]|uniref:Amidase domain-containing protein n=1 Tax=Saitozyma podzolica TaxID=1890683 RepID=A0A427YV31_9TREE|nr:hypothetical protein EHS25_000026 [Saitozyma podzolica]